jgi:hypothetical protein
LKLQFLARRQNFLNETGRGKKDYNFFSLLSFYKISN